MANKISDKALLRFHHRANMMTANMSRAALILLKEGGREKEVGEFLEGISRLTQLEGEGGDIFDLEQKALEIIRGETRRDLLGFLQNREF